MLQKVYKLSFVTMWKSSACLNQIKWEHFSLAKHKVSLKSDKSELTDEHAASKCCWEMQHLSILLKLSVASRWSNFQSVSGKWYLLKCTFFLFLFFGGWHQTKMQTQIFIRSKKNNTSSMSICSFPQYNAWTCVTLISSLYHSLWANHHTMVFVQLTFILSSPSNYKDAQLY